MEDKLAGYAPRMVSYSCNTFDKDGTMKRILLVVMSALLVLLGACQSAPSGTQTATPEAVSAETPAAVSSTPLPTATPDPTPSPTPAPTRITVMAVGDIMCLGAQLSAAKSGGSYGFDYAFAQIKDTISSADLAIGNLETLIASGHPYTAIGSGSDDEPTPTPGAGESEAPSEEPSTDPSGEVGFAPDFAFADIALEPIHGTQRQPLLDGPRINGPESFLSAAVGAGFDVLTNANNHINDYGTDGIEKTLAMLDAYGIPHTGAYASADDKVPLLVDVEGIKIGIVAYTDHLNRSAGANMDLINLYDADEVAEDIAAAKEAGADFTIVYIHWGTENTHTVTRTQRTIAQHIADSGADLILGSHPHCTQEFELLETDGGTVPVIYSLGNFISSMAGRALNRDGMILKFVLEKDGVTGETTLQDLSYIPTLCTNTDEGSFVVLPADEASIASSEYAARLQDSRARTIDVLGEEIAKPE